jgi:hypothetical protein
MTFEVAHIRLSHSRMLFVRAYPLETQEMVFDANNRAFLLQGTCTRGIYDNMKTAVEAVLVGKDRQFNRRFLRTCGVPIRLNPWRARRRRTGRRARAYTRGGGVENQVGVMRERFFAPRLRVTS